MAKRYCVKHRDWYGKWQHVYAFKTREDAEHYINKKRQIWRDDWDDDEDTCEYIIVEEGKHPWQIKVSDMKQYNPQHPWYKKHIIAHKTIGISEI